MQVPKSPLQALILSWLTVFPACSPATMGETIRPEHQSAAQALEPGHTSHCTPDAPVDLLSVDMPSSLRVALESAMKRGIAVVSYDCNRLRILDSCRLQGDYAFAGVSRKEDVVTLKDLMELQANLPIGAARLAGQVSQGSSIHLALVQIGTQRSLFDEVGRAELQGVCDGATHFLRGTVTGAFALSTSASGDVQAAAEVFGYGAATRTTSDRSLDQKDGDLNACRTSRPDATAPPPQCGVPVRLQLIPFSSSIPNRQQPSPPSGSEKMEAKPIDGQCPEGLRRSGSLCVRQTGLCSPTDEEDCKKQCKAGEPGSCYNLAELLRDRLHKEAMNEPIAHDNSMEGWNAIVARQDKARAGYRPYYVKACDGGIAIACDRIYYIKGPENERYRAVARACELGHAPSCSSVASPLLHNPKHRDIPKARELLDRGCRLGSRWTCLGLVNTYFHPPDGSEPTAKDRRHGESILERMCLANDPYRCAELARRRAEGDGLTKDIALSLAYLDRACSLGDPLSCFGLGKTLLTGDGVGRDPNRALAYFDKACPVEKPEDLDACVLVSRLYRGKKPIIKDPSQALVWLGRGCRYGQTSACLDLAEMYELGEGTPKNEDRALELYEYACGQQAPTGCVGQVNILKTRDPERALEISRKGCKENTRYYCDFVREIAGKRAASVFEEDCSEESPTACLEWGRQLEKTNPSKAIEVFRKLCPEGSGPTYACNAVK